MLRDGWLRTGDGGHLYIVDRLEDVIIKSGSNIYSVEVENAITHRPSSPPP